MECQRCGKEDVINVQAKCSDMCYVVYPVGDKEHNGYVPRDLNAGGGDYIDISYCASCGQMQGEFPLVGEGLLNQCL